MLFIGNSYTFLPGQGSPSDPGLPKLVSRIAESIDPSLKIHYFFHTPGGYGFELHFSDEESLRLMKMPYDKVVLQGQSVESLELTPWWEQHGNSGVKSFSVYLPKVLDLVFTSNTDVTLYVNWGWSFKNALLQADHPGLFFPAGSSRAGQKWCGESPFELQKMIDESYLRWSRDYPVVLSRVGDAWLLLRSVGVADEDEFYIPDDWSHPSALGSFVAALALVRDSLRLDVSKNSYVPSGIDPARARLIQGVLARKKV